MWYGINPAGPSALLARQGMIDLNKVQKSVPNNLHMGMEWWAGEASPIFGSGLTSLNNYWWTGGVNLFDAMTAAGDARDNVAMPVMLAMGWKVGSHAGVQACECRQRARSGASERVSTAAGAALRTGLNTEIEGLYQQWQIISQAGDAEQNLAVYPAPDGSPRRRLFPDHQHEPGPRARCAGFAEWGVRSRRRAEPAKLPCDVLTGNPSQEWDIQSAGNCGDIPAHCTNPPLSTTGNYYTIINKATGTLLTANGVGANPTIVLQPPATASNGDFTVPASQGQLWQIVPVHITGTVLYLFNGFLSPVGDPPISAKIAIRVEVSACGLARREQR